MMADCIASGDRLGFAQWRKCGVEDEWHPHLHKERHGCNHGKPGNTACFFSLSFIHLLVG